MNFILIFLISAVLQWVGPWWVIALVPFLISLWRGHNARESFLQGFLSIGTLWLAYGLYLHIHADGAMSNRISEIFSLPNGLAMLGVTALVGATVGGFAALSGLYIQKVFKNHTKTI